MVVRTRRTSRHSGAAAAQITTADVVGVVMDNTGGRLPGVTITARNVATGQQQTAATDSQGNFQILRLAPGRYQISAALDGFRTIVNDVELAIGDRYRFNPGWKSASSPSRFW